MGPRVVRMGSEENSTILFIKLTAIKSKRLRWTGHVARIEGRSANNIFLNLRIFFSDPEAYILARGVRMGNGEGFKMRNFITVPFA